MVRCIVLCLLLCGCSLSREEQLSNEYETITTVERRQEVVNVQVIPLTTITETTSSKTSETLKTAEKSYPLVDQAVQVAAGAAGGIIPFPGGDVIAGTIVGLGLKMLRDLPPKKPSNQVPDMKARRREDDGT